MTNGLPPLRPSRTPTRVATAARWLFLPGVLFMITGAAPAAPHGVAWAGTAAATYMLFLRMAHAEASLGMNLVRALVVAHGAQDVRASA